MFDIAELKRWNERKADERATAANTQTFVALYGSMPSIAEQLNLLTKNNKVLVLFIGKKPESRGIFEGLAEVKPL